MDIGQELADTFYREIAREFILEKHAEIDEDRFERSLAAGKGNWVDAGIIYELLACS